MNDNAVLLNTTLPLFFYELLGDVTGGPEAPASKGFGTNDITVMLPKDRRLAALVLLYEVATKLDTADNIVHGKGNTFKDPYIERAISQFSATTGLPEDDIRRILNRPDRPTMADLPPEQIIAETTNPQWRDP